MNSRKKRENRKRLLCYIFLSIVCIAVLFPILWLLKTSISPFTEIFNGSVSLFPSKIDLSSYSTLMDRMPLIRWFGNTFIVSFISTFCVLCITIPASYVLARHRFKMKRPFNILIATCNAIPKAALFLPYLVVAMLLKLYNTYIILILVYIGMIIPFATIILSSYFETIPSALEEAAMIDGCNAITAVIRVILPLSVPGLLSIGIYCFINTWTEYFYSLILTSSDEMRTLTVGLVTFFEQAGFIQDFTQVSAGAIVSIIPVIIIFLVLQKYFVQGMTTGAVKM